MNKSMKASLIKMQDEVTRLSSSVYPGLSSNSHYDWVIEQRRSRRPCGGLSMPVPASMVRGTLVVTGPIGPVGLVGTGLIVPTAADSNAIDPRVVQRGDAHPLDGDLQDHRHGPRPAVLIAEHDCGAVGEGVH